MAKGQQKSNREPKKPKQKKEAAPIPSPFQKADAAANAQTKKK